jgi:homoserine dehydrogenase
VVPSAVPAESPLGKTGGVTNIVELAGEPIGRVRFSGPGAGGEATSSAVLGDLVAIARGIGSTWAGLPSAQRATTAADPLAGARRWFYVLPRGGGAVTEPVTLGQARDEAHAAGVTGALYPLLEARLSG